MTRALAFVFAVAALASAPAFAQNAGQVTRAQGGASCPGCDLLQAEFSYMDLPGRNFTGARLMQAGMTAGVYDGSRFERANMRFLEGSASRFSQANFTGADLSQAALVGSYFGGARFAGANLAGANLSGSDLSTARGLSQVQLNGACGDRETLLPAGLTVPACR